MTDKTITFYVTFGSQYAREAHPRVDWAHPDGWLAVTVPLDGEKYGEAEQEARGIVVRALDRYWSMMYSDKEFRQDRGFYPMGELASYRDGVWTAHRHFDQRMVEVIE